MSHFDLPGKREEIKKLEDQTMEDGFWTDQKKAQNVIRKTNSLKDIVSSYESLKEQFDSLEEMAEVLKTEDDEELMDMADEEAQSAVKAMDEFEIKVLLSGEYDGSNAILEIHPGAGGTESHDWANMLYRMYTRYCEKKGFKVSVLQYQPGEEAGIKSVTFLVEGDKAYGYLKGEKGVHRLVRISPFDAGARRHTSFASLEVMPQFNDEIEIEIKPEDLLIETKRASGAGGQHINKTDSAIRMVHKPTGIVATCQSGRSQIQNREEALNILKSRLLQLEIENQQKKIAELKGETLANEWGSQIRSYVLHPYSLIKDVRTGYETSQVQSVLDGDLDGFIWAYLKSQIQ
ncbi:peptide chain release factor 2 [Erysipelotrichaceae bacterium NYU-BL-E8]|uniref:Peptide chain release factor 2 n=1 Tax=Ileibacterium valens TaxID=1862668 RepID=A0A1U7NFI8_9FIRM|nr:peptide chain release factor 2 [Ileibacterium valens]OLU41730.1 peptide chain release factor 2 [Erysipelotrichaceae bacterium NYU-BL-F16]OLU41819.1 peptide chain release factor 2 [Erysipelotrichaceae bacterium NYU-BL-E8]